MDMFEELDAKSEMHFLCCQQFYPVSMGDINRCSNEDELFLIAKKLRGGNKDVMHCSR